MRLTVTTFMTIDGVTQAPGAPDEDRSNGFEHGGWLPPYADEDMGATVAGWFAEADAFLLGRRTFEIFAGQWPQVPDENPIAAALNRLPKYVVSTTLGEPGWRGTSVIREDVPEAVQRLKDQPGRELQVHGSIELTRTLLLAEGLVEELRLLIYPVFLGAGRRLFEGDSPAGALRLRDSRTTSSGVVALTYEPDGAPRHGSFALAPEPAEQRILR